MRFTILAVVALCLVPGSAAEAITIDDLAASVSTANLQNHVLTLAGDRYSVAGRNTARNYIATQLQSYGYTTSVDGSGNIIAEKTGVTTPDDIYVVGAHFDAVNGAAGADDNASGVTGMLEMARIFASQSFDSTIRFIGFDLEERGLLGSKFYAQNAAAAGDNIVLATVFDMIGYTNPVQTPLPNGSLGSLGSFIVSDPFHTAGDFIGVLGVNDPQILAEYVDAAGQYAPTLPVLSGLLTADLSSPNTLAIFGDLFRSDHASFLFNGYNAIILSNTAEYRNPNYHNSGDVPSTLDYPFLTGVVQGSLGFVARQAGWVAVPEPSTGVLLAIGLLGIGVIARRSRAVAN